jgi:4-oxalocrotonate tautomerase
MPAKISGEWERRERPSGRDGNSIGQLKTKERITHMPLVTVKLIEGIFTPAQKQQMVRKLTDTMVSIEGENLRPFTLVVIEEVKSGDYGVGGNPFTTADVNALAGGKGAAPHQPDKVVA